MAGRSSNKELLRIDSASALGGLQRGHPGNRRLVMSNWSGGAQVIIDHVRARKLKDLLRADPEFMNPKVAKEIRTALSHAGLAWDKDTAMSLRYGKGWRAKTAKMRAKDEARLSARRAERDRASQRTTSRTNTKSSADEWFEAYPRHARAVLLYGVWAKFEAPRAIELVLRGVGQGEAFAEQGVQCVVPDDLDEFRGPQSLARRTGRSYIGVVLWQVCGQRRDMERGLSFAEIRERVRGAEGRWRAIHEGIREAARSRPGSLRMGRKPQIVLTATGHLANAELVKGAWTRRRLDDLDAWAAPTRRIAGFRTGMFRGTHCDEQTPYGGGGVHGVLIAHAYQWTARRFEFDVNTDRSATRALRRAGIERARYHLLSSYD